MNKNEIIRLSITALTNEGFGFGKHDGMAVFVPFTAVGDEIEAKVVKANKSYAYAKIENILTPSPDRIENACPAFGRCGGCSFRHITYEAELRAKAAFVEEAFVKLGGLKPDFLPIEPSDDVERYRNKLETPVGTSENGGLFCGFFASRSHRIIPVDDCLLQPEIFSEITRFITQKARELKISAYSEERHQGVIRHIYLRRAVNVKDGGICCVIVARKKVPEFSRLAREITEKFPEITGVVLNINPEKTNVILGKTELLLRGKAEISDEMCGVPVEISPMSFYQVNTRAAEKIYRKAAEFAEPSGKVLLDLYCGAGTIGLSMAKSAEKVIGAEIVPEAVENAKANAKRLGITNAEFICADAGKAAKMLSERNILPDVILLDPPRKGCGEETLSACAKMRPKMIVMISCSPATAARDCKRLLELGYKTSAVQAFDLFPRTKHVECLAVLQTV
ncbi:MAG: 23S rRNA (uracil(1939)-C(5))-methyltransferase RlmD [Oscillospiraceae bacterium]|nr:23S rRNA (uracil(1939)-C(5))-methyltransferase RlmD [Oscillospiraceae bacterium]